MGPTQILQGGNSNPSTEIDLVEDAFPGLGDLTYLAKYDYDDAAFEGPYGNPQFTSTGFNASGEATVGWDLSGTSYQLKAIVVKTANTYLNVYTVGPDMGFLGFQVVVDAPDNKDSISHTTFLGMPGTPPPPPPPPPNGVPEGGTSVLMLGLSLIGLGVLRRRLRK